MNYEIMSKGNYENKSASLIVLIFHSKTSQQFLPFIEVKQLKLRRSHDEINVFFLYKKINKLLAPLEICMSKISLKYIPIHIDMF